MLLVTTKYMPATNTRGSRVKASAQGKSVSLPYAHELDIDGNHEKAAVALAWSLTGGRAKKPKIGERTKNGYVWVFETY